MTVAGFATAAIALIVVAFAISQAEWVLNLLVLPLVVVIVSFLVWCVEG